MAAPNATTLNVADLDRRAEHEDEKDEYHDD